MMCSRTYLNILKFLLPNPKPIRKCHNMIFNFFVNLMTFFSAIKKRWYLNILFSYIYFSHKMGLLQSCLTYHYISCISIILNLVGYLLPLFLYWKDGLVGGLDFLRFSLSLSLSLSLSYRSMKENAKKSPKFDLDL
jgi:hypothetical protein